MYLVRTFYLIFLLILLNFTSAYGEEYLLNKCYLLEQQLPGKEEITIVDDDKRKFNNLEHDNYYIKIDKSIKGGSYAKFVEIKTDEKIKQVNADGGSLYKTRVVFYPTVENDLLNDVITLTPNKMFLEELTVYLITGIVEVRGLLFPYKKLQCEVTKPKISYETLFCEGVLEITGTKDNYVKKEEEYFFDELLLKIDYNDPALIYDQESIISNIQIINTSGKYGRPLYLIPDENESEWDENQLIYDITYTEGSATSMKLSLASGVMVQNLTRKGDTWDFEFKITTKCSGIENIQQYLAKNIKIEKPIFAGKDPNELVAASSGSGFFINKKGNIVTNEHVVEGCNNMTIVIDGEEIKAEVIATDNVNDLALLKTDFKNKNYFKLSKDDVDRSQPVKAIGYGFGKNYSSDIKVTAGIVNSLSGYNDNYSEFQMDAAIQSGNSGGPVINEDGQVVGVSVAALDSIAVLEDTGTLPQNVNYAIKTSTLKQFLSSKDINYEESGSGLFSFFGNSNDSINNLIDEASVYLSCYMTYAQIEENMTTKVMFENIE